MLILVQNYKTFFKGTIRINLEYGPIVAKSDRSTANPTIRSGLIVEANSKKRGVFSTECAITYVSAKRATIQGGRGNIEWLRL